MRNVVSTSHEGISTVPFSTASVDFNQGTNLPEGDTVSNPQVRHSDASSMASTLQPVAWNYQMKSNYGKLVIQNHVTDIDLETTEEYNILSAASISFKEKVNEIF